ncbi:RNA polymerase sigma factor [Planctomycetota bacterium]
MKGTEPPEPEPDMPLNSDEVAPQQQAAGESCMVPDKRRFSDLCQQHIKNVYQFLLCRVDYDGDLAGELTQESFRQALQSRTSYRGEAGFYTWLCSIALRQLGTHWRARQVESRHQQAVVLYHEQLRRMAGQLEKEDMDHDSLAPGMLRTMVHRALTGLAPARQEVLTLRYFKGMSVIAIARQMAISYKAAESQLVRAR